MSTQESAPEKSLVGISGWLVLPAIGTVFAPIAHVVAIYDNLKVDLTAYVAEAATVIWVDTSISIVMIVAWVGAAFALFNHRRLYPKLFIGLQLAAFVQTFIAMALLSRAGGDSSIFLQDLGKMTVAGLIWIPYMLVSKRVAATFTR